MLYQDLTETYEDLMKTLDALEELNECEDSVDMEEAEMYVEDINGYWEVLEDLCSVEHSKVRPRSGRYVRNWKLGNGTQSTVGSRFSKVPILTKS